LKDLPPVRSNVYTLSASVVSPVVYIPFVCVNPNSRQTMKYQVLIVTTLCMQVINTSITYVQPKCNDGVCNSTVAFYTEMVRDFIEQNRVLQAAAKKQEKTIKQVQTENTDLKATVSILQTDKTDLEITVTDLQTAKQNDAITIEQLRKDLEAACNGKSH
jgi:hypothetical protein